MNNRLSIAFITYNRAKELIRAIESCKGKGADDAPIIIWDNNSNEDNRKEIEKYISVSELNIIYKYSNDNLGVGEGRNSAWRLCDTDYVLFLDDDAILGTELFLKKVITYMDTHVNIGAAGVNIYEPETQTYLNCSKKRITNHEFAYISNFIGACHVIRKSAVNNDTLYPKSFSYGSEEQFLCLGLYNKGYDIVELSFLTAFHMPSKINRCDGKRRDMNLIVNQYVTKRIMYPAWLIPINTILFILRLFHNKLSIKDGFKLSNQRRFGICSERIGTACLFRLIGLFGIKGLL